MANKVYNKAGGKYSGAALSIFQGNVFGQCVASENSLKVEQNLGLKINIKSGNILINSNDGYPFIAGIDTDVKLSIPQPPSSNSRIDSVVTYIDSTVPASTDVLDNTDLGIIKFSIISGSISSSPKEPSADTIQNSIGAGNPYMVLADIKVGSGVSEIKNKDIIDKRRLALRVPVPDYNSMIDAGNNLDRYVAPEAGIFLCNCIVLTTQFSSVSILVNGKKVGGIQWASNTQSYNTQSYQHIFVAKGDVLTFSNTGGGSIDGRRFVPIRYM